jgi:hypothetical protein
LSIWLSLRKAGEARPGAKWMRLEPALNQTSNETVQLTHVLMLMMLQTPVH